MIFEQSLADISYLQIYRTNLLNQQKNLQQTLNTLTDDLTLQTSTLNVTKLLLEKVTAATVSSLEDIISIGLAEVFEKDYKFKIVTTNHKNRVAYNFVLVQGENEIDFDAVGGGLINFVDVLLRLFFVMKSPSNMRKILFLDEPFANLDANRLEKAGAFIRQLVKKFGFDVLMVSHSPALRKYADAVWYMKADCSLQKIEQEDASN